MSRFSFGKTIYFFDGLSEIKDISAKCRFCRHSVANTDKGDVGCSAKICCMILFEAV